MVEALLNLPSNLFRAIGPWNHRIRGADPKMNTEKLQTIHYSVFHCEVASVVIRPSDYDNWPAAPDMWSSNKAIAVLDWKLAEKRDFTVQKLRKKASIALWITDSICEVLNARFRDEMIKRNYHRGEQLRSLIEINKRVSTDPLRRMDQGICHLCSVVQHAESDQVRHIAAPCVCCALIIQSDCSFLFRFQAFRHCALLADRASVYSSWLHLTGCL